MNNKIMVVLAVLAVICVFFAGYGFAILTVDKEVTNNCELVADVDLTCYADSTTTIELINLQWGTILPTQTKTKDIWVENNANIPLEISLVAQDWLPVGIETYLTFSYSSGGVWLDYPILQPHERAPIIVSIVAGSDAPSGDFSFTIVVHGETLSP